MPQGELGVAADRGQRSAQLVARVGREPAQPRLARGAAAKRPLHMAKHPVKGGSDLPDLGPWVTVGTPAGSVTSPESSGSSVTWVAVAAILRSGRSEIRTHTVPITRTTSKTAANTTCSLFSTLFSTVWTVLSGSPVTRMVPEATWIFVSMYSPWSEVEVSVLVEVGSDAW